MKFGVREICDVVFKAKSTTKIGNKQFAQGQPVLYIDSAKTSTIESAATTVYATGGRGNTRLITWEGEKTLTFTVEDALLSPIGFAVLSGAGLFNKDDTDFGTAMVHKTAIVSGSSTVGTTDHIQGSVSTRAPIFISKMENGSISPAHITNCTVTGYDEDGEKLEDLATGTIVSWTLTNASDIKTSETYFVDYYEEKTTGVTELVIDAENFGGYYYVEASTLFRREHDGYDMPAEIVFPKVKVQSNFTFNMASSGDPSTFSFVMDAMPDYTMFEPTKKTLCAIQIIDDTVSNEQKVPVMTLKTGDKATIPGSADGKDILDVDSVTNTQN